MLPGSWEEGTFSSKSPYRLLSAGSWKIPPTVTDLNMTKRFNFPDNHGPKRVPKRPKSCLQENVSPILENDRAMSAACELLTLNSRSTSTPAKRRPFNNVTFNLNDVTINYKIYLGTNKAFLSFQAFFRDFFGTSF